jgi:hypothetical protein
MQRFAEIGADNVVQRVIVADSLMWCAENLGGWWVETIQGHPTERFAGRGMVYAPSDPQKFLYPSEG